MIKNISLFDFIFYFLNNNNSNNNNNNNNDNNNNNNNNNNIKSDGEYGIEQGSVGMFSQK